MKPIAYIMFLLSIMAQSQCITNGGNASDTGLKTWCWGDITIPTYSDSKGVALSNGELKIDSECNESALSIVGDRLHFFIDPTDPPIDNSWCSRSYNMRAEVRTNPWNVNHPKGTEEWFGFSYYFGNDYIIDVSSQWAFFQVHNGIEGENPHTELMVIKNGQFSNHNAGEIYVVNNPNNTDYTPTGITPTAGEKIDIVIHAVWGDASNGMLQIWINGESVYNKQVRTIFLNNEWGGNAKFGIYKWPWNNAGNVNASASQGITSLDTSMGALRIITRQPNDPDYLSDSYNLVAPEKTLSIKKTLFPNPTDGSVNFEQPYEVFDIYGRKTKPNINRLSNGMYIIVKDRVAYKLIKKQ